MVLMRQDALKEILTINYKKKMQKENQERIQRKGLTIFLEIKYPYHLRLDQNYKGEYILSN